MRLKQLHYVVEVAKCQSFSKASKKLFVSQPALSMAISTFEEEIGATIFYRTPAGAALTVDGERILTQIEYILSEIERLSDNASAIPSNYITTIAAIPTACNSLTISLLSSLSEIHPEIILNIFEIRPQKILASIYNGIADIAIGSYSADHQKETFAEAKKNGIYIEPLFDDNLYAFLPRNHSLAKQPYVSLEQLKDMKQAIFNDFMLIEGNDHISGDENMLSDTLVFSDRTSIKQAVAAELAYAILPHQMVLDDIYIKSGLIRAIPIEDNPMYVTNYIAWRKRDYCPKYERIILEEIQKLYEEAKTRLENLTPVVHYHYDENSIVRY